MIQVKKITLTPTLLNNAVTGIFTIPLAVLDAPASGYVNSILGLSHDMVFVSAAYGTASTIIYRTVSGVTIFSDAQVLANASDFNKSVLKTAASMSIFTTTRALYVTTNAQADTGNSDIVVYIVYETKVLS